MSGAGEWVCPHCGPVCDLLHGEGGQLHCLECDRLVAWEAEPAKNRRGWTTAAAKQEGEEEAWTETWN